MKTHPLSEKNAPESVEAAQADRSVTTTGPQSPQSCPNTLDDGAKSHFSFAHPSCNDPPRETTRLTADQTGSFKAKSGADLDPGTIGEADDDREGDEGDDNGEEEEKDEEDDIDINIVGGESRKRERGVAPWQGWQRAARNGNSADLSSNP